MKKPIYKRKWFIVLVVIFAIGIIGNLNKDDEAPKEKVNLASSEEKTAQTETTERVSKEAETTEAQKEDGNRLELGETVVLGDYEVTVTNYRLSKDFEGKDVLVITYNWKNNSKDTMSPFVTLLFKGFQDGVETDDSFLVEDVDLRVGQKEVKPGASIENCFATVGITDISKPLELELDKPISLSSNPYKTTIDLSTIN